jgi:hypothetical protein
MVVIPAHGAILMQTASPTKALRLPVELAMTILRAVIIPQHDKKQKAAPVWNSLIEYKDNMT